MVGKGTSIDGDVGSFEGVPGLNLKTLRMWFVRDVSTFTVCFHVTYVLGKWMYIECTVTVRSI